MAIRNSFVAIAVIMAVQVAGRAAVLVMAGVANQGDRS